MSSRTFETNRVPLTTNTAFGLPAAIKVVPLTTCRAAHGRLSIVRSLLWGDATQIFRRHRRYTKVSLTKRTLVVWCSLLRWFRCWWSHLENGLGIVVRHKPAVIWPLSDVNWPAHQNAIVTFGSTFCEDIGVWSNRFNAPVLVSSVLV